MSTRSVSPYQRRAAMPSYYAQPGQSGQYQEQGYGGAPSNYLAGPPNMPSYYAFGQSGYSPQQQQMAMAWGAAGGYNAFGAGFPHANGPAPGSMGRRRQKPSSKTLHARLAFMESGDRPSREELQRMKARSSQSRGGAGQPPSQFLSPQQHQQQFLHPQQQQQQFLHPQQQQFHNAQQQYGQYENEYADDEYDNASDEEFYYETPPQPVQPSARHASPSPPPSARYASPSPPPPSRYASPSPPPPSRYASPSPQPPARQQQQGPPDRGRDKSPKQLIDRYQEQPREPEHKRAHAAQQPEERRVVFEENKPIVPRMVRPIPASEENK